MDEDELLRRFAALRAPSTPPVPSGANADQAGPSRPPPSASIDQAILDAQKEDDELAALAEGRPLPEGSVLQHHTTGRRAEDSDNEELARRLRSLTGRSVVDEDSAALNVDDDIERFLAAAASGPLPDVAKDPDRSAVDEHSESLDVDDDIANYLNARSGGAAGNGPIALGPPSAPKPGAGALEEEARAASRAAGRFVLGISDSDPPQQHDGNDEHLLQDGEDDEDNEQDILQKALEEAEFERHRAGLGENVTAEESETADDILRAALESRTPPPEEQEEEELSFTFPSLPTHTPQLPPAQDNGGDEVDEAQKRMDLLLGLNRPTQKPTAKFPKPPSDKQDRQAGQGWNLPGWDDTRDDDLTSWCCICNKDATLICLGCDDDPYCTECWNDGHGSDGEQGHKAKRFVRAPKAIGA